MERKAASGIMLTLLLASMLTLAFNVQQVKAEGTIYIRPDGTVDPSTAPINRVGNVYTFTGDIYEPIVVEADNIVIDGNGYTLQGSGWGYGFYLSGRSSVTIKNVTIEWWSYGILLDYSSGNSLSRNNFTYNGYCVYLDSSDYNTISENSITANYGDGIRLYSYSDYNTISGNNITANGGYGIGLYDSSDYNTISGNSITATNNWGVWFWSSSSNSIAGNNITNNFYGIIISYSSGNSVSGNNIAANKYYGVFLYSSVYSTISGNNITNSMEGGIVLYYPSDYNTISGNNIANNYYGMWVYSSSSNTIYHNNFIDNTVQAYVNPWYPSVNNVWDDGYPSGGNYWSDYTGVDADGDGIGDTPYIIDADNSDRYPLVNPILPLTNLIQGLIETIGTWNLSHGTENSLISKLDDALHLLAIGNENGAIHKLMEFMSQIEALRDKKLYNDQADYLVSEAQRIIDLING